ncbi:hypothetical protein [Kitasatospora sp. NPDC058046]|uniref:hypothetical protein n=1 Tax=Kitasatospora sp. NPDC058046 TaxID=3346312 RepID=UPI0036DA1CC0
MTEHDKATDPTCAYFGPIPGPVTKTGPDGKTYRRRWALTGSRPTVAGNAQFESAYVLDDGTADGEVVHEWQEAEGLLPACLSVTGWTYWSCHRAYERLWKERQEAAAASR